MVVDWVLGCHHWFFRERTLWLERSHHFVEPLILSRVTVGALSPVLCSSLREMILRFNSESNAEMWNLYNHFEIFLGSLLIFDVLKTYRLVRIPWAFCVAPMHTPHMHAFSDHRGPACIYSCLIHQSVRYICLYVYLVHAVGESGLIFNIKIKSHQLLTNKAQDLKKVYILMFYFQQNSQ